MKHNVPFISQYSSVEDGWEYRGCGIAALKMVLDYWSNTNFSNRTDSLKALLEKGLELDAYLEGVGWKHVGLVDIAKSLLYEGHNVDRPNNPEREVFEMLKSEFKKGPIIASVRKGYDSSSENGHLVFVTGIDGDIVFVNDPMHKNKEKGVSCLPIDTFLKGFKKRYVIIYPKKI